MCYFSPECFTKCQFPESSAAFFISCAILSSYTVLLIGNNIIICYGMTKGSNAPFLIYDHYVIHCLSVMIVQTAIVSPAEDATKDS